MGSQELGKDIRVDAFLILHNLETVGGEELDFERQTEHPAHPEFRGTLDQDLEHAPSDTLPTRFGGGGQRADLGEILPHHV